MNVNWMVDDSVYDTTTCTIGDDIILPPTPTKRGYTFLGWVSYTPIEYIESTGTQYIDTGITDVTDSEFGIVVQQTQIISGLPAIVAARAGNSYKTVFGYSSSHAYAFYTQCSSSFIKVGKADLEKHTLKVINTSNNQELTVDNTTVSGSYHITQDKTYSLYICADHTASGAVNFTRQRVYSFYAKKNGVLIQDLIPVLDGNGVACMYDKVSHQFFYNGGTGNFIAGPEITE
jgi:hypothetical protein